MRLLSFIFLCAFSVPALSNPIIFDLATGAAEIPGSAPARVAEPSTLYYGRFRVDEHRKEQVTLTGFVPAAEMFQQEGIIQQLLGEKVESLLAGHGLNVADTVVVVDNFSSYSYATTDNSVAAYGWREGFFISAQKTEATPHPIHKLLVHGMHKSQGEIFRTYVEADRVSIKTEDGKGVLRMDQSQGQELLAEFQKPRSYGTPSLGKLTLTLSAAQWTPVEQYRRRGGSFESTFAFYGTMRGQFFPEHQLKTTGAYFRFNHSESLKILGAPKSLFQKMCAAIVGE